MAKRSDEYWQKRFEILQEALLNKGDKYYAELIKQYEKAARSVQDKITLWYMRLADNNEVSLARAKQMLSNQELKELKWDIKEYIRHGKENAINQQWVKELENASARVHISKLEAIQIEIQQQVETLAKMQEIKVQELLQEIYTEGYYQTSYEIQKGINTGWDIQKLDTSTIEKVMSNPWTVDRKTFSDRIWSNKEQLLDTLNKDLTQSIIRGDAPDKLIKNIADKFDVSKKQAGRLVMTESAYFSSLSRSDSYEELGVKKYKIVATLDLKTSAICRSLDGKPFDVSEYKVNVTAPPFHVHCRTTTAPYIEGIDDLLSGQRAARDPITGKTVYVDDKMTYPEWYEKHVKGNPQAELKEKKLKNAGTDQKQFDDYKQRLGTENLPKSLDDFQILKYTNTEEWNLTKYNYKLQNSVKSGTAEPLKSSDKLQVAEAKYTGYLFNPDNANGYAKGKALSSRLGYNESNYKELDKLIKSNINKFPAINKGSTNFGEKYEVNMVLKGVTGKQAKVKVGIMFDKGTDIPKLTTVFIDRLKEGD